MKTFFVILVLLAVLGFAAMMLGTVGFILFVLGVAATMIALLVVQYDQGQRIEEKLDRMLAICESGKTELPADEAAGSQEGIE